MNESAQPKNIHYLIASLTAAVIIALSFSLVWKEHNNNYAMAGVSVLNTAEIVAQQVEYSFDTTNEFLESITTRYQRNLSLGPVAVQRLAASISLELSDYSVLSSVGITNASGEVVLTTEKSTQSDFYQNIAQSNFFKQAKAGDDRLIFEGPLQITPQEVWVLILAHRIVDHQNTFQGIVYGVVPVEYIGQGFSRVDLGPQGIINLRTTDFSQVIRYPALSGADADIGNRNVSQTIQQLMRNTPNRDSYVYTTVAPIDGTERVYAYKKFSHSPFWMTVGRATEDVTYSVWQTATVMTVLSLTLTVILFWGAKRLSSQKQNLQQRIQEKEKAEKQLREGEKRLSIILNSLESCVYLKDTSGRYIYVNNAICTLLGLERHEIIGFRDQQFCDCDTAASVEKKDHRVFQNGEVLRYEEIYNALPSGNMSTFFTVKLPLRHDDGTIYALCGISTDISKRIKYEKELLQNRQFLQSLADNLPGLVGYWSKDRTCQFANVKYLEWFDVRPEHVEGVRVETLLGESIYAASKNNIEQALQGREQSFERVMEKATGERVIAWVQYIPDIIQQEVQGFFVYVTDITEFKEAQQEKELLSAQLLQAQKMEAIGTLAGGIAHDFNNILGAIIGYAEMALDVSPTNSEVARDIEKILVAGQRAADLVKQILAFSRQAKVDQQILAPVSMVKETIKLLRSALPSTIEIKQRLNPATDNIQADPTQIHQVVMNLCTNAFHAMENTGGVLEITLDNSTFLQEDLARNPGVKAGSFIHLVISDSGPGIPQEVIGRIFEPYFTTKGVGKGTGLGLSLVHGIVTSLGGVVTFDSSPEAGTAFHVYIPSTRAEESTSPGADDAKLVGSEHILLVDDEEILAEMGKAMLERLGYQITTCCSSQEALEIFQKEPDRFDAVVTDQTMPGMTGMELARKILQFRPGIPIILCTGFSSSVNEERALENGIHSFILKPVRKGDLATALRRAFDQLSYHSTAGEKPQ
nr:PAS domain-containing protein [uncultured Desulfobulbus sp.]